MDSDKKRGKSRVQGPKSKGCDSVVKRSIFDTLIFFAALYFISWFTSDMRSRFHSSMNERIIGDAGYLSLRDAGSKKRGDNTYVSAPAFPQTSSDHLVHSDVRSVRWRCRFSRSATMSARVRGQ